MKRTARSLAISVSLAVSASALGAEDPTTSCLTPEQRSEFLKRLMLEMAVPVVQAALAHKSALAIHSTAKKALDSCESAQTSKPDADACTSEREAAKRTREAVDEARPKPFQAAEDFAKRVTRAKEIRAEYPDCGTIDRSTAGTENANSCLSTDQESEIVKRVNEAVAALTMARRSAGDGLRPATPAHTDAKRSMAAGEANRPPAPWPVDFCDSERRALQKAADALEAERTAAGVRSRELVVNISERIKAIRAEYPNCESIER